MDCSEDDDDDDDDWNDDHDAVTKNDESVGVLAARSILGRRKQKETSLLQPPVKTWEDSRNEPEEASTTEERLRHAKEQLRQAQQKRDELVGVPAGGGTNVEEIPDREEVDAALSATISVSTNGDGLGLKKKMAKVLKKQLHAMKLRHAAIAKQLQSEQDQQQHERHLPPLTALQEG